MNKPMINRFLFLFICCSFVFSANAKVVAAISTLKGLVMVKPVGSRKYIPAYKGQMLKNGEWVKTKEGVFVAIVFLDGSNIKIQQQTEIKISSFRMTAKDLKTNLSENRIENNDIPSPASQEKEGFVTDITTLSSSFWIDNSADVGVTKLSVLLIITAVSVAPSICQK